MILQKWDSFLKTLCWGKKRNGNLKILKMKLKFFLLFCGMTYFVNAQNTITLNADKGKDIINKNIYGHFAEHLGHCIYGGLYVGDNNTTIPNKNGVRLDVIDALKKLKVPVL